MAICEDDVSSPDILRMKETIKNWTGSPQLFLNASVSFIGLFIVFIIFWQKKKPVFVKVIWVLITAVAVLNIIQWFLFQEYIENGTFVTVINQCVYARMLLNQVVHWLFAYEYFAAVVKLPLMSLNTEDPNDAEWDLMVRVKVKLLVANLIFYTLVIAWILITEFWGDLFVKGFYIYLDGFNKLISAVLLVFSLYLFNRRVRLLQQKKFYTAEKLMMLHMAIFFIYILSYFGWTITHTLMQFRFKKAMFYYLRKPQELLPYCRVIVANTFFDELVNLMNLAMIGLFTYLSVVFSEPLEDYQQRFLLMFQQTELQRVERVISENEVADRYNKSAVRDANLIIIRALTNLETEGLEMDEEVEEEALSDGSAESLTSEEKEILFGSVTDPTDRESSLAIRKRFLLENRQVAHESINQ